MFANLSLNKRLWLLGLVSALAVAILALSSVWFTYHSKNILLAFVDEKIALNRSTTSAYANGLQMGQALRNILLDPGNKKAYDNFAAASDTFKQEIDKLIPVLTKGAGGKEFATRLKGNIDQWQPLQKEIIELVKAGNGSEAKAVLISKETPAWRSVREDLLDLVKRTEVEAAQDRTRLLDGFDSSSKLAITLSLLSFLLVGSITIFVARGILRQVGGEPAYAASMLHQIAQGDLTHRLAVGPGDTSSIIAAMSSMQSQMHQLISGTISSADSVVQESEGILADAAHLSETAQNQSSAASSIAAAVEQLTVSIGIMSDSAIDAGRLSTQSEKQAHDSLGVVSATTDTIQKVADGMAEASITMEDLSSKVTSINGIVQTIREIADQTNLLALNAAIEAARAGEQGRGFAVVADEVRKLAERTTSSTQEISNIVGGVRQTTDIALETMARAKTLALTSAAHTAGVRNAVVELDQSSVAVNNAITSIATALREQSAASTDIAQRVELIAQGIRQTHDASSSSTRRSNVLVDLSHALKDSVSRFRT
ncbi:MAG: methyl-accepting chemotaxis protein [Proteobacteria bacterium]|nr:methyl-accepting chemotaxis protein [Pseudomonadota bacterium]